MSNKIKRGLAMIGCILLAGVAAYVVFLPVTSYAPPNQVDGVVAAAGVTTLPSTDEVLESGVISAGFVTYEVRRDPSGKVTEDAIPVLYTYHVHSNHNLTVQSTSLPEMIADRLSFKSGYNVSFYDAHGSLHTLSFFAAQPHKIAIHGVGCQIEPNIAVKWDDKFKPGP